MERILGPEYTPNEQDVLRSCVSTTGVVECTFKVGQITYRCVGIYVRNIHEYSHSDCRLVDVGGVRSQRRKWIRCFDDVKAVIFIAALNDYNMTLFEDGYTVSLLLSLSMIICSCCFITESIRRITKFISSHMQ